MPTPVYLIGALVLAWSLYKLLRVGRRPNGYPPGPPTIPVLGNLHLMPARDPHLQFEKWAKEYGPIYSLMLGTKTMIVMTQDKVIKDLLEKRGVNYNSRPDLYVGQELSSGGHRMGLEPYTPKWRLQRRLAHETLNSKKVTNYTPYLDIENRQMLYDMMNAPSDLLEIIRRFSSSMIGSVVYGFRWKSFDDPSLQYFFHTLDRFVEINTTGGSAFADFFPVLRNIPAWLYPSKHYAIEHHKEESKLYRSYWLKAKNAIVNKLPSARPCACSDVVQMQAQEHFDDNLAAYFVGTLFEAGSDTTSTQIYAFAQAMLLFPEVQKKAQAELDRVIGDRGLPVLEDINSLPYVWACVKESYRWHPTTILGALPHSTVNDDQYMGYHIPRAATLIINTWGIHRDPNRYPDPDVFNPDRFFGDVTSSAESAVLSDHTKRDHFAFGGGRRFCPGTHVADNSLFLAISRILWAFDLKPKKDASGNHILPVPGDFTQGLVAIPKRFDLDIVPRSEKRKKLVDEAWEGVQRLMDDDGQFLENPI